jgi:curved DNA-binding protein CbpA
MTLYDLLDIPANADADAIKEAFRRLAKSCHPDLHPNSQKAARRFKQIAAAYNVLKDPTKRAKYDRWLKARHRRIERARSRVAPQWAILCAVSVGIAGITVLFLPGLFPGLQPMPPGPARELSRSAGDQAAELLAIMSTQWLWQRRRLAVDGELGAIGESNQAIARPSPGSPATPSRALQMRTSGPRAPTTYHNDPFAHPASDPARAFTATAGATATSPDDHRPDDHRIARLSARENAADVRPPGEPASPARMAGNEPVASDCLANARAPCNVGGGNGWLCRGLARLSQQAAVGRIEDFTVRCVRDQ